MHLCCRRYDMDKCTLFAADGTRFLHDHNFSNGVLFFSARLVNRYLLRRKGVDFRFKTLNASNDVCVTCIMAFNNSRLCDTARRCLAISVLMFANVIKRIMTGITRVNYARRNVTSNIGRCVNVKITWWAFIILGACAARP